MCQSVFFLKKEFADLVLLSLLLLNSKVVPNFKCIHVRDDILDSANLGYFFLAKFDFSFISQPFFFLPNYADPMLRMSGFCLDFFLTLFDCLDFRSWILKKGFKNLDVQLCNVFFFISSFVVSLSFRQ